MSNYPNMSYCMCENTNMALQQVLDAMEEKGHRFIKDMNEYEWRAFQEMFQTCEDFIREAQYLVEEVPGGPEDT